MNGELLSKAERDFLLRLARASVEAAAAQRELPSLDEVGMTPAMREWGASFVTLTREDGSLRGCIGALEAYQPLAEDVREHAAAAATEDPRFPPVRLHEAARLRIEISRLSPPQPLIYKAPAELPGLLRRGIDGLILRDGRRRATFLPQVWEKISQPEEFLQQLCMKMGVPADLWRRKVLQAAVYQVEEFREERLQLS